MKLITDFRDYYDHWFDHYEPEFNRLMVSGPTKQEQFKLIEIAGYKVIPHGKPEDFSPLDMVVVYLDERLHAGEGKIIETQHNALAQHPDKLCRVPPSALNTISNTVSNSVRITTP